MPLIADLDGSLHPVVYTEHRERYVAAEVEKASLGLADGTKKPTKTTKPVKQPVKTAKHKREKALSSPEYEKDVLSGLREQWARIGRDNLDFDEFVSGLTIVKQFIEREGGRLIRSRFDMSTSELRILLVLDRVPQEGGLRPTDLFRHLLVSSGAVTKQLDRLEARGLIRRLPDPRNIRGFRTQLTDKGQQMIRVVGSQHEILPTMERIFNDLSQRDRRDFLRVLHTLTQAVQKANALSPFD